MKKTAEEILGLIGEEEALMLKLELLENIEYIDEKLVYSSKRGLK